MSRSICEAQFTGERNTMEHRHFTRRNVALKRLAAAGAAIGCLAVTTGAAAGVCSGTPATTTAIPVSYSAFAVTDVSLGGHMYRGARVTFTFKGNTRDIYSFAVTVQDNFGQGSGSGSCIEKGDAGVIIETANATLSARFLPGQVFVSFDTFNQGIGFSSYTGPNGLEPVYPLGFLYGSVGYYSNDLFSPSNTSGNAWSCIGYPPLLNSGNCLDPQPYPLKTNLGDFFIYQPFVNLDRNGNICCDHGGSLNRGTFSVVPGRADD
jgi:hypothetical protein